MAYDFSMTDLSYPVGDDTQRVVLQLQNAILKRIARGEGLDVTCRSLCEQVEQLVPGVICSVLTVDRAGRMHPLAGSSLPESYSQAIDGAAIGPLAGSCGPAAYLGTDISVADIATDPRWADFKHLVAPLGLRGCWSSPISRSGRAHRGDLRLLLPRVPRSNGVRTHARRTLPASLPDRHRSP
ncbi:GAF domain-containing protein [Sphingomonas aerolata]|uniref:GAF domain-containing protein n=1 Tax=Sphingomonas aerolata TaxID=185951 RepID=UPI002FE09EAA